MLNRASSVAFGAVALVCLGSVVYAAGPGAPERGIPYRGTIEQNGNPISATDVSMEFVLYDGDEATGEIELWRDTFAVDVASGAFNVVLGRGATALPDSIFSARELWLEVIVESTPLPGRTQVWAMAQATRAAFADVALAAESVADGSFEVANGRIWRGSDPGGTNDLGLYSNVPDSVVRVVSNGGRISFYNDGGRGTNPSVEIEPARTTIHNAVVMNADVTGLTVTTTDCENVVDNQCEVAGNTQFLDRMNNIECPANKVMVDWDIINCGSTLYRGSFRCCSLTVR